MKTATAIFDDLPIGARFRWQGKVWKKVAPWMADDENHHGHIFPHPGQHEVEVLAVAAPAPQVDTGNLS